MTEKRFEIICEDSSLVDVPVYVISDDKLKFDIYGSEKDAERLCTLLNENEQLKKEMGIDNKQKRKIKELTTQLQTDDVCTKCKHHYLIKHPLESSKYYISKCKKEHEECSKEDIRYCEDFELKGDE